MKTISAIITCLLFISLASAQDILTIGEVYDFHIGDEFHKRSDLNNQPPNAERSTILDKWYSGSLDTVWYKVYRDRYQADIISENPLSLEYRFYKDTITISFTNLDSSIFYKYPYYYYDSLANDMGQELFYDSITEYSSFLCGSLINEVRYHVGVDLGYYNYAYGQGLGTVKEFCLPSGGIGYPSVDTYMFYYKKDEIECGTPDLRTGINTNEINYFFSIYPNPTEGEVIINTSLSNKAMEYQIYDMTGQECKSGIISKNELQKISVAELQRGVYLFKLKRDNKVLCVRRLVKL